MGCQIHDNNINLNYTSCCSSYLLVYIVNTGCFSSSLAGGLSSRFGSRQRNIKSLMAGETFSGIGGGLLDDAICKILYIQLITNTFRKTNKQNKLIMLKSAVSKYSLSDVLNC